MYNHWSIDNTDSVKAFESIQFSIVPRLIAGDILRIEKQQNDILITIDQTSGIDYIRKDGSGLQGIAWRAQWCARAWDTFTIRYKRHSGAITEYEKRVAQIKDGYLFPAFTMQAYFNNRSENKPLSVGIVKTVDLYELMHTNPELIHKNKSDNDFLFVKWRDIQSAKCWWAS